MISDEYENIQIGGDLKIYKILQLCVSAPLKISYLLFNIMLRYEPEADMDSFA